MRGQELDGGLNLSLQSIKEVKSLFNFIKEEDSLNIIQIVSIVGKWEARAGAVVTVALSAGITWAVQVTNLNKDRGGGCLSCSRVLDVGCSVVGERRNKSGVGGGLEGHLVADQTKRSGGDELTISQESSRTSCIDTGNREGFDGIGEGQRSRRRKPGQKDGGNAVSVNKDVNVDLGTRDSPERGSGRGSDFVQTTVKSIWCGILEVQASTIIESIVSQKVG